MYLHGTNIAIRDFTEIIVPKNGSLEIQDGVFIGKSVEIGANDIFIDKNTGIQNNCILLGNIKIGKHCLLGPNIYISSGKHYFNYKPELLIHDQDLLMRLTPPDNSFVIVEDDVWIGTNVVIINGATIGKGAIIGANSFVNKDIAPYVIAAGIPIKTIGKRLDFFVNMPDSLCGNEVKSFPYFYRGLDYSLKSIEKYEYAIVVDNVFVLYLLNKENLPYINMEVDVVNGFQVFEYAKQQSEEIVGFQLVKLKVSACSDGRYEFFIKNYNHLTKIKKVFFSE